MPDSVLLAKVVLVGTLAAAAVMGLSSMRAPRPWRTSARWSWAIGIGVLAACGAMGQWPRWPPLEDRARFLTLVVPLTLLVETAAAAVPSRALAGIVRAGLALSVAPILLYNTVYLADLNGQGSAEWAPFAAAAILGGLALLLTGVWWSAVALQARTSTLDVHLLLLLVALAAGVTVMLSGYFGGGLLGLGLAGAICGAVLGSLVARPPAATTGSLGTSVIGIFSVVLVGRYFGSLSTDLTAALLLAPLMAWIVELPRLRVVPPAWRRTGRLVCVAAPLVVVVVVAWQRFQAASHSRPGPLPPSATGKFERETDLPPRGASQWFPAMATRLASRPATNRATDYRSHGLGFSIIGSGSKPARGGNRP